MSKSLDNYIGVTDAPADMFGKVMSISDAAIPSYLELCTFTPMEEVKKIIEEVGKGKRHPKEVKMDLAQQIVEISHGREAAIGARESFVSTFEKKEIPEDIPEIIVEKGSLLVDALLSGKVVSSKSDFRRLLDEGAIRKDGGVKIEDPFAIVEETLVLKIGKHRFCKLVPR
jgi:tyrosyl-tRNA synthetase